MRQLSFTFRIILLVLGWVALSPRAQALNSLPTFQAEVYVNARFFPCDPFTGICENTATGTGHATGLLPITLDAQTFRNGPFIPCAPLYGTRTFTTESGSIFLAVSGTGCQNPGGVIHAVNTWVITGGSGAFANASGSGTETSEIAASPFLVHYSGTLSY